MSSLRKQTQGFTLIELLVVIAIIMILTGMLLGAVSMVRRHREKVLAAKQVHDIAMAAEAYFVELHQYPVDTGLVELDGTTTPFPPVPTSAPTDPAEANAIYMYLGRKVYETESSTKFSNFLIIHPLHLKKLGSTEDVMVDPWGMPYCMDCVHVNLTPGAAVSGDADYVAQDVNVQRIGAPYDPATPIEKQVLPVKVWSAGPDKQEGSKVFSHVTNPTEHEDDDNIASWR